MNLSHPDNERVELFDGRLKVLQKKAGYRFSIDSVLLGSFASERASGTVADLGTGSAILPVILARHKKFTRITGIEIQQDLVELAGQNIALNEIQDRVSIVHVDIKNIRADFPSEGFDNVVTNPPFYPAGTGRINPDKQSAIARHELCGTLQDFISGAAFLLKQTGKFMAVFPASRVVDLIAEMRQKSIEPKTLRLIHSRVDDPASMVLVEGIKAAGKEAKILPPLILYDNKGEYTEEVKAIFERI